MFIESLIKRKKGTTVVLDGNTYYFSPELNHTANIDEPAHIERLLSITEGFKVAEPALSVLTETTQEVTTSEAGSPSDDEREHAVSLYVAKFGKKPHYKWTAEKIIQALEE